MSRLASIFSSFRHGWPVIFLALLTACALAETQDQASENSAPKGGTISTNIEDGLHKQAREDLVEATLRNPAFKNVPRQSDSLAGALPTPMMPQQRDLSPAEIRRLKERLDRSHSWLNADPDTADREVGKDAFAAMASDNGSDRDTLTILKRQYQRLEANRLAATNNSGRDRLLSGRDDTLNRDLPDSKDYKMRPAKNISPFAGQTVERNELKSAKGLFDSPAADGFNANAPNNIFSSVFAPANSAMPLQRSPMDDQRASDFRKLLDGGSPGGGLQSSALSPLGDPPSSRISTMGGALGNSQNLPTVPGYNPSLNSASSLNPSFSANPSAISAPVQMPLPSTPRMNQFTAPTGPSSRIF